MVVVADELFECVRPFFGVGGQRVKLCQIEINRNENLVALVQYTMQFINSFIATSLLFLLQILKRRKRFNQEYRRSLKNLVQVFINQLVLRAKEKPSVVKEANLNLADFMKQCLSHMDRGYVFQILHYLKDQFSPPDTQVLFSYRKCFFKI